MTKEKTEEKKEIKEKKTKEETKEKEEQQLLLPLDEYVKSNIHIGTKTISPNMRKYIYRRKADGVAVLNTTKIDEKIRAAISFINNFETKDIILVCRRDVGWKAAEAFGKATGIRFFLKYPPGIITNPSLETFFEPKLVILCDPTIDRNVLNDAVKIHIPVVGLVGTSNSTANIDLIIPCNNRFDKSIGLVLYLLAKHFNESKGNNYPLSKEDFYSVETSHEIRREDKIKEKEEDRAKLKELVEKLKEKKAKQKAEKEEALEVKE